jgi:iron-sulfur cluster assembly accessory protein
MRAKVVLDRFQGAHPCGHSIERYHQDVESATATQILNVTDQAAAKALVLGRREGFTDPALRVRVVAGGCSGFGYKLSFEEAPGPDDTVIEAHGLKVLVDSKSSPILAGSTLEFNDALLGGGFKVNNPQAVHECACGESFSV